jgi:cell division transport system ATP-binding protein
VIRFDNVSKRYPEGSRLNAIHHISFHVDRGEFVYITGASGAGKSTLLRLASMEEIPTEGEVIIGAHSSASVKRRELPELRRRIGIVFQDFRLWRDWTIAENVEAAIRVTGEYDPRVLRSRSQEALHQVGLAHRARHYPSQLSGGEQQRVSIARAIVNRPLLLLADEPTGNLDPTVGESIFQLLRDVHYAGTAVLVATHDLKLVERYGKRVLRLEQGRCVEERADAATQTA